MINLSPRYWIHRFHHHREEQGGLYNVLVKSACALTCTSALSYALGLARDRSFAVIFGASAELDVYNATFVIPDLFLALFVTGALSAAFVPLFTRLDENDPDSALKYINQMLSYMLTGLLIASILFAIFLPWLTDFLIPGFDQFQTQQYIELTRLMLISPVIFTLSNTFGNVLISKKEFLWYGLAPVMYNLGIILGVLLLAPELGIYGLVLGTILGALLHLGIRLPAVLKQGYRPGICFAFDTPMKETFQLMGPKILQIGMWQVLLWWFIRLASQLEEGSVTIYSFARNFQSVPVSLIGIAIALSAFSSLSHLASHQHFDDFKSLLFKKSKTIVALTSFGAITLAIISEFLIGFLFGGGKFSAEAVQATAAVLSVYCLSIPLESLMHLLARAHYSLKHTFAPSLIHIVCIGMMMFISWSLLEKYEVFAIPISFTIGLLIQTILLSASLSILFKKRRATYSGLSGLTHSGDL